MMRRPRFPLVFSLILFPYKRGYREERKHTWVARLCDRTTDPMGGAESSVPTSSLRATRYLLRGGRVALSVEHMTTTLATISMLPFPFLLNLCLEEEEWGTETIMTTPPLPPLCFLYPLPLAFVCKCD
jgi:hypothetical protein